MNFSVKRVRRRQILKSTAGLLLVPIITGCAGLGVDEEPDPQVDVDVLWSRRQEWTGKRLCGNCEYGRPVPHGAGKDHLGWVSRWSGRCRASWAKQKAPGFNECRDGIRT